MKIRFLARRIVILALVILAMSAGYADAPYSRLDFIVGHFNQTAEMSYEPGTYSMVAVCLAWICAIAIRCKKWPN